VIEMARKSSWRVGQTRRKYRKVNRKRRLCDVTKKGRGNYKVRVVENTNITMSHSGEMNNNQYKQKNNPLIVTDDKQRSEKVIISRTESDTGLEGEIDGEVALPIEGIPLKVAFTAKGKADEDLISGRKKAEAYQEFDKTKAGRKHSSDETKFLGLISGVSTMDKLKRKKGDANRQR